MEFIMRIKTSIIILLLLPSFCFAKIWRIDNNSANKPDFASLQTAHDAVSVGDTLYIAGHGSGYGNLEITKQIVLIGPGYFLDQNLDKGVNPFEVQIGQIIFKAGAENSIVMSCSISSVIIQCNNIILKRNIFRGSQSSAGIQNSNPCSGIKIQQCFIGGSTYGTVVSLSGDNLELSNNFVSNANGWGSALQIGSSGLLKNNIFIGQTNMSGMICENNIGSIWGRNNIERNNIALGDMNIMFMLTGNDDEKY